MAKVAFSKHFMGYYLVFREGGTLNYCSPWATFENWADRVDLRPVPVNRFIIRTYGGYIFIYIYVIASLKLFC